LFLNGTAWAWPTDVVNQDVSSTESLDDLLSQVYDCVPDRHVYSEDTSFSAELVDLASNLVRQWLVDVHDGHMAAFFCKPDCHRLPQPLSRPGYDRYVLLHCLFHGKPPLLGYEE
jgi:hypothetical protein